MIFLLFGPPGCGKGTQASFVASRLNIPAISTGEMFRAECKAGTELGKLACSILSRGGFVGDDIVNPMVAARIAQPDCAGGFVLDGYPRTVPQAAYLDRLLAERRLPPAIAIHIDVPAASIVSRITARRQCPACGQIYNLRSQRPKSEGICDVDGTALVTREDDKEDVIRRRLEVYEELTGPVLDYYGGGHRVNGDRPPEQVSEEIGAMLAARVAAV